MRRTSRRLIAGLAVTCFAGAFALTPSEVRSRLGPAPATSPVPVVATMPAALAVESPAGDPFAARVPDDEPIAPAHPVAERPAAAVRPNRALLAPLTASVSAVALGDRPEALIDDGGRTRLVSIGDRVDGVTVAAIDPAGITLADGRRIALAPADARP